MLSNPNLGPLAKKKWIEIQDKKCKKPFCIKCLLYFRYHRPLPDPEDTAELIGLFWIESCEWDISDWEIEEADDPIIKKIIMAVKNEKKLAPNK